MTRVWEIPVPYLMLRAMLFSPERKPHLFRISQRNYVNMNSCLGDFMDCLGRKVVIQFFQGTNELGIRQHPGLRIRSRLLMKVSLGGLQRKESGKSHFILARPGSGWFFVLLSFQPPLL